MVKLWIALFIVLTRLAARVNAASDAQPEQSDVFVSGSCGYHTYRIPALVTTTNGTVLAFCEGRRASSSDSGAVDLLLRRSFDGGRTWQPQQIVWTDKDNTCGNPTPVVDRVSGEIWLLMTWNRGTDTERAINSGTGADTRRVFITGSTNDGLTWSASREITPAVKKPQWRWYATGPGNGIQLTRGPHTGRLVVPANHTDYSDPAKHPSRAHVIYSDDHGRTWQIGGVEDEMTNESTVVERADGSLLHNMRSYHGKHRRAIATSTDGGASWSPVTLDPALIEPVCQASLLRFSWPESGKPGVVLFSNPASTRRENLTVRLSYDDGATWPVSRVLNSGPSAYSCVAVLPDRAIGCLYERGTKSPYERITLARFSATWLAEGTPR
jgi:sialidase-1